MNIDRPFNNEIIIINNFIFQNEIDSVFDYVKISKEKHVPSGITSEYFSDRLIQLPTENNIAELCKDDTTKVAAVRFLENKASIIKRITEVSESISKENLYLTPIEGLINSSNEGMPAHFDDSPENTKNKTHYGLVLYLNDNYDGGEIYYPKLNIEYKPKSGDIIIHPGTEEYMHGVRDISNGTRYAITTFAFTLK